MSPYCDVLIIGSGAAGLISAINLANEGFSVLVLTKDAVTESSSSYAQGGVAVPLALGDSPEKHIEDTLRVGQGLADRNVVRFYINSITGYIKILRSWGIPFLGFKNNHIEEKCLGNEAAHSHRRILKIGGDLSGRALMKSLWETACRHPNISISQGTVLVELLKSDNDFCVGGIFQDINNNVFQITAKATILASGGLASLYSKSTSPNVSTGDGIACAHKIGAKIKNLEFIQFHPTALDHPSYFLLSEALRGEGALLYNKLNERFMFDYSPENLELAPRAIVSNAVWREINRTGAVFLDIRHLGEEYIKNKFQGIYECCKHFGYDLANDSVPVTPAAHYAIGGVQVSLESKTSVDGLWAIGEVACTGLHGADRLASNSLLECIVGAFSSTQSIKEFIQQNNDLGKYPQEIDSLEFDFTGIVDTSEIANDLKHRMWKFASFDRKEEHLLYLLDYLEELEGKLPKQISTNPFINQLKNQVLASKLLVKAALSRRESIGTHQVHNINYNVNSFS
ncbi:MAG: FAD-dependent oxidoreductase [Candidatus Caenarcaniphilales bacterium]|nr:FAD-dependent oxidoreductase [Candidatus Caenarcaniphilales bacterium]